MNNVIEEKCENGIFTIRLAGRIDTTNAASAEENIQSILSEKQYESVVLDAENLEYISSAGLRVILRLLKKESDLKLINVSSDVYDILEMTGFTEIMTIEKAYRQVSVENCEVIGQGANGKVYQLDPETIIKVYMNPDSLPDIHRERELARKAFVLGIPTAIPYDVVKVGEGYGSVFELLNAKSFAKLIAANPDKLDDYISLYVDMLRKIHSTVVSPEDMPDMRIKALGWLDVINGHLPEDQFEKISSLLHAMPEDNHMIHGDYHMKNIMMQNGEVLLIDMDTLSRGNPVFEFAQMYMAYIGFAELDHEVTLNFLGIPYEITNQIWEKTLKMYFNKKSEDELHVIKNKIMLTSYVKFLRRTIRRYEGTKKEQDVIELCHKRIAGLLPEVDSLCI